MNAFSYCVSTEVVFGENTASCVGEMVAKHGGKKVFVVYGGGSVVRSGLLDSVCDQLKAQGLSFETYGGVQPNPRLDHAREGVQKAIAMGADFILAVGGGSVIDACKSMAVGIATPEVDLWDYWMEKADVTKAMPIGVVLTIPAAGSETSKAAVLTNASTADKRGIESPLIAPVFAIMDPVLPGTLPKYQVGCGVTDIMMHTLDRYFNPVVDNELSDMIALGLLKVVVKNGTAVYEDATQIHEMSEIMWAGSVSHNGLTGLGNNPDFAPHQLGHALSAIYDLAHGASLAAVWPSWARYTMDVNPKRFADYGRFVFGVDPALSDKEAAVAAIAATEQYFLSLGMPIGIQAAVGKRTPEDIQAMAMQCSYSKGRTVGSFQVLGFEDMVAIYNMANEI